MAIVKRCFICAHKQNADDSCTNVTCPRSKEYWIKQENAKVNSNGDKTN